MMRKVILESPFAGDVESNIEYAKAAIRDCLAKGDSPIASHLLFTQPGILMDELPEDRKLGIDAGHAWIERADAMIVYADRGVSKGMLEGIRRASEADCPIEFRFLEKK